MTFPSKRLLGKTAKLLAGVVAALGLAIALAVTLSTGAARADSGFCGVRSDQFFAPPQEIYVVRNKCGSALRFAVVLPEVSRRAQPGCQTVAAYSNAYYWDVWATPNWYIVNC